VIVKLSTVTYNETTFTMPIQETRAERGRAFRRGRRPAPSAVNQHESFRQTFHFTSRSFEVPVTKY
jgi:hypothetical protein